MTSFQVGKLIQVPAVLRLHLVQSGSTLVAALMLVGATVAAGRAEAGSGSLGFEQVFRSAGEPTSLHYEASFFRDGKQHQLEVWREGNTRLKRRTDDAVETYVTHPSKGPDFELTVLDLKRKILTRIGRDSLYRIGNFTEWFDLAHGLKFPTGDYALAPTVQAPQVAPKPYAPCRWYELTQGHRNTRICWSVTAHLPMLMLDGDGALLWQITRLERSPNDASVFKINDEGFVRNDANQDIDRD